MFSNEKALNGRLMDIVVVALNISCTGATMVGYSDVIGNDGNFTTSV